MSRFKSMGAEIHFITPVEEKFRRAVNRLLVLNHKSRLPVFMASALRLVRNMRAERNITLLIKQSLNKEFQSLRTPRAENNPAGCSCAVGGDTHQEIQ